ncbi:hypothetical protein CYMTET_46920 [Cymbomonas tetramitiformis]|uniref:Uncharacterized protein n=1 Tax=Cymbomonas tetramitiformis TaxID=36881 RepID=A0AAE0BWR6_9CHLO|nr:hypothetical protein CYMTET_46920 [Cymbomonas tetramitiformis]
MTFIHLTSTSTTISHARRSFHYEFTTTALLQDVHALTATVVEFSTTLASFGSAFQHSTTQIDNIIENYVTKEEFQDESTKRRHLGGLDQN